MLKHTMASPSQSCCEHDSLSDDGFTVVSNRKNLKRKSKENRSNSWSSDDQTNNMKKAATTQLQPVVLQSTDPSSKSLATYSPITIDRCLRKSIGQYDSCKPIRNGNLVVLCKSSQQIKTLLNLKVLKDTGISIPVLTSLIKPVGAKGVIYNVPTGISDEELLSCLKQYEVKHTKRFKIKMQREKETSFAESKTVLLHFECSDLPEKVQIGYLSFTVKQYIPKPLRCYKCNRFGHVASKCRGNERCAKCGGSHTAANCSNTFVKCVNCNGNHSAASKECPRYHHEAQVLQFQASKKLTYAEASKRYAASAASNRNRTDLNINSNVNFPPLTAPSGTGPTNSRPITGITRNEQNIDHNNALQQSNELQTEVMDEIDFTNNFMFGNPIYFIAFLTEVINQSILAREANESINIYEIISESAGKRMGIPIDVEQLKSMT